MPCKIFQQTGLPGAPLNCTVSVCQRLYCTWSGQDSVSHFICGVISANYVMTFTQILFMHFLYNVHQLYRAFLFKRDLKPTTWRPGKCTGTVSFTKLWNINTRWDWKPSMRICQRLKLNWFSGKVIHVVDLFLCGAETTELEGVQLYYKLCALDECTAWVTLLKIVCYKASRLFGR